jgi:predicted TIM-barrel fold metal-dependent hydrolase
LPNALKQIDASRLIFATHYPVHDPAPALAKLSGDRSLQQSIRDIAGDNARRLFHL